MLKRTADAFPIEQRAEQQLDRRRFLCGAGTALLAVAGGRAFAAHEVEQVPASITVAALDRGEPRVIRHDDVEAIAVRLHDDTIVAFDRRCPHLGCPVVWASERGRFECPCHHAAFDAHTGQVLFGPPRRGLRPIAVRA